MKLLEVNIKELEINVKNRNIINLYWGVYELELGYHP
jgi:hypothetical protein